MNNEIQSPGNGIQKLKMNRRHFIRAVAAAAVATAAAPAAVAVLARPDRDAMWMATFTGRYGHPVNVGLIDTDAIMLRNAAHASWVFKAWTRDEFLGDVAEFGWPGEVPP